MTMDLKSWLTREGWTQAKLATALKVSQPAVCRYLDDRIPEARVMGLIYLLTNKEVEPNDLVLPRLNLPGNHNGNHNGNH